MQGDMYQDPQNELNPEVLMYGKIQNDEQGFNQAPKPVMSEFPDEEVQNVQFQLIPGRILQQCQSKAVKERMGAFDAILITIEQNDKNAIAEISQQLPLLMKESNAIILQKLLQVVMFAIENNMINSPSALGKSIAENNFGSPKQGIKDSIQQILLKLSKMDYDSIVDVLINQLSAKSAKIQIEASACLLEIMKHQIKNPQNLIQMLVNALQNKEQQVRKNCTDILVQMTLQMNKNDILQILKQKKLPATNLQTIEQALSEMQPEVIEQAVEVVQVVQSRNTKYLWIQEAPQPYALPKAFDERLKNPQWKEKKQVLEDAIAALDQAQTVQASFDINRTIQELKLMVQEELTAPVVGLIYKFLGACALHGMALGSPSIYRQLLQTIMNRVKERKFAIISGFQIFSQSLLVKYHIKDIIPEYFTIALPHKNPEVKEDLCKFLKVVYATSAVYCLCSPENENQAINWVGNDQFPNSTFMDVEEGTIPEEGERSYGMQLNSKLLRQKSINGAIFATFFVNGELNLNPVIMQEQIITFVNAADKLLNDIQENIRQLSKRMFCLFIIAHISEAYDALQRSGNDPNVQQAYECMFSLLYEVLHQHKRKIELQQMLSLMLNYLQVDIFNSLIDDSTVCARPQIIVKTIETNIQQIVQEPQQPQQQPQQMNAQPKKILQTIQTKQNTTVQKQQNTTKSVEQMYKQRMSSSSKFVVDPNNQNSPVNKTCLEEFFNQFSTAIGGSLVQSMFIKGVVQLSIPVSGSIKTLTDGVKQLIETNKQGDSNFFNRDLILRYSNLLLCDGFVAKQLPSPSTVKLALELIDSVIFMMQNIGQKFNSYDMECGCLVLLGRLEQFNNIKHSLMKTIEDFYFQSEKQTEMVEYILSNYIGKSSRYLIRQIPTKISLVRVCLAMACDCAINQQIFNINATMFTNLISQQQQFGVENGQLTDCSLTQNLPIKVTQAKQIATHLLQLLFAVCASDLRQKITPIIQRQCPNEQMQIFSPVHYLQAHTVLDAPVQEDLVYQPFQPQQQVNTVQHQKLHKTDVLQINELQVQPPQAYNTPFIPQQQTYNQSRQQMTQPLNYQAIQQPFHPIEPQQPNIQYQITEPPLQNFANVEAAQPQYNLQPPLQQSQQSLKYQSLAVKKTPNRRVTFAEEGKDAVESMPFNLVDMNKLSFTVGSLPTDKFEPKTPDIRSVKHQKVEPEMQENIQQLFNPVLSNRQMVLFTVNLFKCLTLQFRQVRQFNNFAVESQIQQIIRQVSNLLRSHLPQQQMYSPITDITSKLIRNYCLIQNELFQSTLSDQENLLKLIFEDLIFASALFNNQINKSLNGKVQGLIHGTVINILQRSTSSKIMCALVNILSQFNTARLGRPLQCNWLQFEILSHPELEEFQLSSQFAQDIIKRLQTQFLDELVDEFLIRQQEADLVFDKSDLSSQIGLRQNYKELETNYFGFMEQVSKNHVSSFENSIFCLHLFFLKQKDAQYQRYQEADIEFKLIQTLVKQIYEHIGNGIYLFTQKVPRVNGVELRGLLK
ncbi:Conserved_hypothetical protein [Hexamita inflata]|uniref:TOG domain-containing protein n=1 Tax=Hexamita inflata TaxID=28002 RepID=A0AA86PG85_9EUKA|nr:Conserved hypothetical protein [Hexamita inflata]